jgi:hypothetical protein
MKQILPRLVPFAGCVALLTGCAWTKETISLNYTRPPLGAPIVMEETIAVEKLKDVRGSDPYLVALKGVQYKTSGTYVTAREVADIVTDALKDTLTAMNCKVAVEHPDLIMTGDILKYDSVVLVGFWAGAMEGSIQLNLKLSDATTGALLWSEVLSGYTKIDGLQVDRAAHRQRVAEEALQDVMRKLSESQSLRRVLLQHHAAKATRTSS